jgi:N-acetylglucosamine-6-phosphate deacetylase
MSPASGLFDFQVNGFAGIDYQRDDLTLEQTRKSVLGLQQHGTSRIFATLITDEVDKLCRRYEQMEKYRAADPAIAAMFVGYHLEGPWLSPEEGYRGAHPPGPMRAPSMADFRRLQAAAGGRIKLVTLAPEWPGSAEFIAEIVRQGVHVSIGHSNASNAHIDDAIKAGARFCTHLGNGAPQMMHRHDNIIQRLLARDELTACLIPDGIHLPPFVLRNFVRAKPKGKVLFTTDCMSGAGAGPGTYTIGLHPIEVGADGIARNPGSGGGFAGSTLAPDEGVQRVAQFLGISVAESQRMWSEDSARAFGIA